MLFKNQKICEHDNIILGTLHIIQLGKKKQEKFFLESQVNLKQVLI